MEVLVYIYMAYLFLMHITAIAGQLTQDSPSSLMIGPPPMIIDEFDPNCWNFTYGSWRIQEFYTPNYPGEYLNNTDCVLYLEELSQGHVKGKITVLYHRLVVCDSFKPPDQKQYGDPEIGNKAPSGFRINLDFRDKFMLEKSDGCKYDFLEVRDGPFAYSPIISRFCGADFPPIIISSGRHLWMRFKTDDLLQYGGFRAVYSYHKDHTQNEGVATHKGSLDACRVPIKLTNDEADGLLLSNDIPFHEDSDPSVAKGQTVDCTWEIYADKGHRVHLKSSQVEMKNRKRCDLNNITIYQKTTLESAVVEEFCRGNNEVIDIISNSNRVFVRLFGSSLANKPYTKIVYTLVRKGECSEMEFNCGDVCIPASLSCNGVDNCRDRSDEKGCPPIRTTKGRNSIGGSGSRSNVDGGGRPAGGDTRRGSNASESAEGSSMDPLYIIIPGAVAGVILTCILICVCVLCRIRRRNKEKRQEMARQKATQRNALEIAVCNSSNTSTSLSRQNNESQGLRSGGVNDRQHYVTFAKVNPVSPNTNVKDGSHRYSLTDHGISTSIDDVIPDQMTESGNYKRFLTMDVAPDEMRDSTHQHVQGKYPASPTGVMGLTNLDYRMPDAYQSYHGNQWQQNLKDDSVMYPYGTPRDPCSSPFLGISKPFSFNQPDSVFESKYLKALKAKENETVRDYPGS